MIKAVATLKNMSPYSQSRHYEVEKKRGESHRDYEERTWRERCHYGDDGLIFMPPMMFKNCISEAAKYISMQIPGKGKSTYTKHFEAGLLVMDALNLPIKKDDVPGEWLFVPSDGKRGGSSRVLKCFPVIREWRGDVTFYILDETLTQKVDSHHGEGITAFEHHLREAGNFIGVGRFRPRNNGFYGRFTVEKISMG
jgi:hypothetical protein